MHSKLLSTQWRPIDALVNSDTRKRHARSLSYQPVGPTAVPTLNKVQFTKVQVQSCISRRTSRVNVAKQVGNKTANRTKPHLDPLQVAGQMCTFPPYFVDLGGILVYRQLAPQVRALLVPKAATNKRIGQTRCKNQPPPSNRPDINSRRIKSRTELY